jgi:hypothetical protein
VLPSGQKLTLGLLTTITLHEYAQFPAFLLFLKSILETMSCKGLQHQLEFHVRHLSCVKMAAFEFCLQSGKQMKVAGCQARQVGWLRDDMFFFGKKFLDENGSVRQFVVM